MFHEDETQISLVSTSDTVRRSMDAMLLYVGDKLIAKEGNIGRGRLKIRKLPRPDVVWFAGWNLGKLIGKRLVNMFLPVLHLSKPSSR
jgi:hypothetical protein